MLLSLHILAMPVAFPVEFYYPLLSLRLLLRRDLVAGTLVGNRAHRHWRARHPAAAREKENAARSGREKGAIA